MNNDNHDREPQSPQLPGAELGTQAQLDDPDLCPDEATQAVCNSEPKLETTDATVANAVTNTNQDDTDETTETTASNHAETSDAVKPCQRIHANNGNCHATLKQRKFAVEYANNVNGNGTLAAKLAGYKGNNNQLAVQASVNLRNRKVQQLLAGMVDLMTERALQRLGEALDATTSRAFLDKNGNVVYTDPAPDHKARLRAIEFLFDLRGKCGAVNPSDLDELAHGTENVAGGDQMEETDHVLLEQAAAIEDKLAELEFLDSDDHEPNE